METNTISKKQLKSPIRVGILFSIFTIIIFEFGVIEQIIPNRFQFYLFLIVCNFAMYFGFVRGANHTKLYSASRFFSINKIVSFLFWIALIVAVPKYLIFTRDNTLSFSEIIARFAVASTDSASLYMEHNQGENVTGFLRYINYIVVFLSPLYWAYTPLSLYYWKNLKLYKKIGSLFIYFLYLAQHIVTGVNIGVFRFVVVLGIVYVVKTSISAEGKAMRKRFFSRLAIIIMVVLVGVVFASYFNMTMSSRIGDNIGNDVDRNSVFWVLTPPPLRNLVYYFTSYMTHAYNALIFSFTVPWECTYGLGHSFYLLDEFDPNQTWLWPRTYNMKLESLYGWDHWVKWHTPYVWFANDVSHFGVPVVLFFLLRYFGRAWRRFKESGNLISFLIFMLFVEFMSFISANNILFQSNTAVITFWLLVLLNRIFRSVQWQITSNEI